MRVVAGRHGFERERPDGSQSVADTLGIGAADGGQFDTAVGALEEPDAELVFEEPYLAADRALCQGEFVGGSRKAAELGDGIKGGERAGGRQEAALMCEHGI